MLPCPKCGYDNELGRIFCHQCGQKLDLDAIKPPSRGGKPLRRREPGAVGRWIRRVVELLILAVLLYGLFLMSHVVPEPPAPSAEEANRAQKKWSSLEKMVSGSEPNSVEVTAAEVNALVANLKAGDPKQTWGFLTDRVWLELRNGTLEWNGLLTLRLGGALKKKLWVTLRGVPKIEQNQLRWETAQGSIGRLACPAPVVDAIGFHRRVLLDALRQIPMAKETLSQLHRIDVHADRLVLSYQPR